MHQRLNHLFASYLPIILLLFSFLMFGCQPAPPTGPVKPTGEVIELEFWTLQMLNFKDYIEGMIGEYEQDHPNVKIKWVDVPFSEGEKKALTSMLTEHPPDIINLNPDFSAILASRGALVNMSQAVSAEEQSTFLPVAWQGTTLNGKTFGLPWYLTSAVTIYNSALLKQAGFRKPPTSYEQMKTLAKTFREKKLGYVMMPTITQGGRFFRVMRKQGIPLWNDKGTQLVFADNGAGKELAFWVDLYKQGLIPPESLTESQQAAVDRYQSGTLGMLLSGPNFLNIVEENAPEVFKVTKVAEQFPKDTNFIDFSEMILVVPSKTQHPKEAVDFALYVTNSANTLKLSTLAPVLPPRLDALEAVSWAMSPDVSAKARNISAKQLLSAKTAMPLHPQQNRLNQIMDFYTQSAMLGQLTPQEAMQKAQAEMNKLVLPP